MTIAPDAAALPILLREVAGGVATLTLNRPKQLNALSEAMLDALLAALAEIAEDEAIRVVVLAGNGPAFCAGHDLKEMRARREAEYYRALFAKCGRMMQAITALPQPVIARVHGIATAAGCQLVAACDLAVASQEARFATSGINVGLFCSTPAVPLTRNMGRKQSFEMLMTGDFLSAEAAASRGLVNAAVPSDALDSAVAALAERIVAKSPVAVRTGKAMFYRQIEQGIAAAYDYAGEIMAGNMMAADAAEGIDAFIAKRAPRWTGG
ncbi:MAG: Enoyl-CoA hydratase/isomerase [Rhodospirillales bacterium]|jgi:enoyl-CoA hydratase/carnithine racemase|nr:Enoyl-CoA hydratase/isomerase [Rhodospirillales bacterium]